MKTLGQVAAEQSSHNVVPLFDQKREGPWVSFYVLQTRDRSDRPWRGEDVFWSKEQAQSECQGCINQGLLARVVSTRNIIGWKEIVVGDKLVPNATYVEV